MPWVNHPTEKDLERYHLNCHIEGVLKTHRMEASLIIDESKEEPYSLYLSPKTAGIEFITHWSSLERLNVYLKRMNLEEFDEKMRVKKPEVSVLPTDFDKSRPTSSSLVV